MAALIAEDAPQENADSIPAEKDVQAMQSRLEALEAERLELQRRLAHVATGGGGVVTSGESASVEDGLDEVFERLVRGLAPLLPELVLELGMLACVGIVVYAASKKMQAPGGSCKQINGRRYSRQVMLNMRAFHEVAPELEHLRLDGSVRARGGKRASQEDSHESALPAVQDFLAPTGLPPGLHPGLDVVFPTTAVAWTSEQCAAGAEELSRVPQRVGDNARGSEEADSTIVESSAASDPDNQEETKPSTALTSEDKCRESAEELHELKTPSEPEPGTVKPVLEEIVRDKAQRSAG
jgi:hypothetical protein